MLLVRWFGVYVEGVGFFDLIFLSFLGLICDVW